MSPVPRWTYEQECSVEARCMAISYSHVPLQERCRAKHTRSRLYGQAACPGFGVTMQACVRSWLARQHLARWKGACIAVQALWRGRSARHLSARIRAAIVLQKHARGRRCRAALAAQLHAAVLIQNCWRGAHARAAYQHSRRCIILVMAIPKISKTASSFDCDAGM